MEVMCHHIIIFVLMADKAMELTELGKGKHHIGDYLPPEELQKFLEKVAAIKEGRNPGKFMLWRLSLK